MSISVQTSSFPQGKTLRVAKEAPTVAGTQSWTFTTDADAGLFSLYVTSVSGNLDVSVYTQIEEGKDLLVITFPTISAPTTNLLLKKAAQLIGQFKVVATWDAACDFEIYARGISSAEASVKILGATDAEASQITITTTPTILIPAAITDRSGLILKNHGTDTLWLGFSDAEATPAIGYPIEAGESLGMDISSGVVVYGAANSGTLDIRILQAGG